MMLVAEVRIPPENTDDLSSVLVDVYFIPLSDVISIGDIVGFVAEGQGIDALSYMIDKTGQSYVVNMEETKGDRRRLMVYIALLEGEDE